MLLHVSKLVAKLRNRCLNITLATFDYFYVRMLVRVGGSWAKLEEEEAFPQTASREVLLATTTLSLEARVQEEEGEGGEEEEVEVNLPSSSSSMSTPLAITRGEAGEEEEEGGELLNSVIHHPP